MMRTMFLRLFIVFLDLLALNYPGISQNKFEVSGGFGYPDLLNVRIKYGRNFQIGPGFGFLNTHESGTFPWGYSTYNKRANTKISLDLYCHFAGESKFSNIKPWYINVGICHFFSKNLQNLSPYPGMGDDEYIYQYTRFGRVVNLSHKLGLNMDIGPLICYYYSDYDHKYLYQKPVALSISFSLFLRL